MVEPVTSQEDSRPVASRASPPFSAVRMLADDLTGALDTAAQFASVKQPVLVTLEWPRNDFPDRLMIDCATRECVAPEAVLRTRRVAQFLDAAPGRLSFFKIDSLLRGHPILELAECLKRDPQRRCIIAPALPYQRRVMRAGRQYAYFFEEWTVVGPDIAAALRDLGFSCTFARPGDAVPEGISLWDSESDADLDAIVQDGLHTRAPTLWCGSAGLAGALARSQAVEPESMVLKQPLLGIFGSNHPVMLNQIAHDSEFRIPSTDYRLGATAWVTFDLPADIDRVSAGVQINRLAAEMIAHSRAPGTLVVSGGETLHGLAHTLEVRSIAVMGQLEPGIPVARLIGGPWHDTLVISKSGAFGPPDFLVRLRQRASA